MTDYTQGKNPCKRCQAKGKDRSGNNFHYYGEGMGGHCFSCGFSVPSDAFKLDKGMDAYGDEDEEVVTREAITDEENAEIKSYTGVKGKGYRGLRDDITKKFGVRYEYDDETGEPIKQYVPTTIDGKLVGYRTRLFPKDFGNPIGKVGKECDMIGEFLFKSSSRTCIITGGEIKMLATYQMLSDNIDMKGKTGEWEVPATVCSTLGESGAHKQVQSRYEFFNQFEKIIVCMDADEPGRDAAQTVCKALPKGKAFIMEMRLKDADEYIKAGREADFMKDYWNAKLYTPDGIVASSGLSDNIRAAAIQKKIPLPPFMHKLQKMMGGGVPLKVIVNLMSASGTGKSTIIDECTYFWSFNSPYKMGIVSMESDAGQYGTKILSRHLGRKIDLIESIEDKIEYLDRPEILAKERELLYNSDGTPRFFLIEDRDGGPDSIKELVQNLIISCGCQVIVLDPLQDVLAGMTNEQQEEFMAWQKGMVKSHDVTFFNVNHSRKSQGGKTANSTGAEMFEEDIQGSSSIFKSAACNLVFMRNKEAEDPVERNTTKMKASKIRWTGNTGVAGEYYYDNFTHTMWDLDDWLAKGRPQTTTF